MFDEADDSWDKVNALVHLANASLGLGEFRQAEGWLNEAMPLARRVGDPWQIAFCLNNMGEVARAQEDYERARNYYEESEALYRQADALGDHARLIHTLGYIALHDGDAARAEELFLESLEAFRKLGNKRGMAECLGGLAAVATARGDATWAAQALAAADGQIAATGAAWWPADRVEVERTRRHLREALGDAAFEAAWERGRALKPDEALARVTAG
jgi:tetratricopeptide (TPR) repeat protein